MDVWAVGVCGEALGIFGGCGEVVKGWDCGWEIGGLDWVEGGLLLMGYREGVREGSLSG